MGTIYLVRHGQASFGAADYDQLSDKGYRQGEQLGQWWHGHGMRFDAVYTGTLRRHRQTLEAIARGMQWTPEEVQQLHTFQSELNEYDSDALLAALNVNLPRPEAPEQARQHFRSLCAALEQWMGGTISPAGMPSWQAFQDGITGLLQALRRQHVGQQVLVVSSGGPISTAVAAVLDTAPEQAIGLNMRIRNTAITELGITPRRINLHSFNAIPHLAAREWAELVTMA
ncbi:histidine phosphatase family protein [Corticibacter populi]|uniref:Histidine phosphatase family protein n=1 Tax=Corticibacter populi TaxID=1550736 RepID=A0A3M6QJW2_9BURK|nr:histidine phosphatase family protein [Corticibacter populi]RMX03011.1 histidine phosphatase family protein [Corticibacter populi]RZS33443.1 broad specificity phosphatase PhoE [Corticibacter populi]